MDYKSWYSKNCTSLNALTFSKVIASVKNILKSEDCPPKYKIIFSDWLFRKVYMYFSPSTNVLEELCEKVNPAIDEVKDVVTKGRYLAFHNIDALSIIALHFYFSRFTNEDEFFILQMLNDTQLIKYCIRKYGVNQTQLCDHFLEWIKKAKIFEQKSNLLDVLLKYYPSSKEVQKVYAEMRYGNKEEKSLYSDDQNVHDEDIKLSVLDVAEKLIEWSDEQLQKDEEKKRKGERVNNPIENPGIPFKAFAMSLLSPFCKTSNEKEIAQCVIERMCIDTTDFKSKKFSFTISDIFLALINYIYRSPLKDNFYEPLKEELEIMCKLCSSGYVARFVNILRGFDERFEVTISFEKQLYSRLAHKLHLALDNAPDEVIEGSYEEKYRDDYLSFVKKVLNKEIPSLIKDYGANDVKMEIVSVVNKLAPVVASNSWKIKECNNSFLLTIT